MPTEGDIDQLTAVLLVPLTLAVIVVDCPPLSEALAGVSVMETGVSEILAVAVLVASAALAAVMVTVCADAIVPGAV